MPFLRDLWYLGYIYRHGEKIDAILGTTVSRVLDLSTRRRSVAYSDHLKAELNKHRPRMINEFKATMRDRDLRMKATVRAISQWKSMESKLCFMHC